MDEADHCDRIAIMDAGQICRPRHVMAPAALKAQVGKDRVEIRTDDDEAARLAIREKFGIESRVLDGVLTFSVADGERFVPQLFEMGMAIRAVSVARPDSLDDVFMAHTGTSIRDADQGRSRVGRAATATCRTAGSPMTATWS